MNQFPESAPSANPVFFRTYSRQTPDGRESWDEVCDRTIRGLAKLGKFTQEESQLVDTQQRSLKSLNSGRWLWVGGTEWIEFPDNFSGAFNCVSTNITDWESFGLLMNLAMMGCGTGAVLEPECIDQLPPILNRIEVTIVEGIGTNPERCPLSIIQEWGNSLLIEVGDSREGWVLAYQAMMEIASDPGFGGTVKLHIDLGNVRPAGEKLSGFGGTSNPIKLPGLFERCANILNKAVGRQLNALECCLLIDEAALVVVAGSIRRSAGIRQFASEDSQAALSKMGLWQQGDDGNWRIDPELDALRMANHTRVFHRKPTLEEVIDSVQKQYYSGEGAIQYAPEAIARSSADLLDTQEWKSTFLEIYNTEGQQTAKDWLMFTFGIDEEDADDRLKRYGLNPCGEVIGSDFHCNLSEVHLNQIAPDDFYFQKQAFRAGALSVAALLQRSFTVERYRKSRESDPIVGVSFTGLFDFFVHLFGAEWLQWWAAGRPQNWKLQSSYDEIYFHQSDHFINTEAYYLKRWRTIVEKTIWDYCDRHGLKRPNRCTTVQPAGSKSLLTGASPGWHPPKAARFIRRITFRKDDPVALACIDYGYTVVPSQSDTDAEGNLLNDPFDDRCTEWLVEIPTETSWANMPGADQVDISQFSATAQFDFYMQVQQHYVGHNTSATIELREHEIEPLAQAIHEAIENDEGYISSALLARFDDYQTFPRLPFEPIDKATYNRLHAEVLSRRKSDDFEALLAKYDRGDEGASGPAGCDSDKCLFPVQY